MNSFLLVPFRAWLSLFIHFVKSKIPFFFLLLYLPTSLLSNSLKTHKRKLTINGLIKKKYHFFLPKYHLKYLNRLCSIKYYQEEGWVVCRAFKKRATGHTKSIDGWDSSYFYDEPSGVSSVVDPIEYVSRQPQSLLAQNLMCKQEIEAENLSFLQAADQYLQLPQLESPSLPILKRPSSISLTSENSAEEEQNRVNNINNNCNNANKKVTDWRALDKFVASQLSQEDRCEGESSFGAHDDNSDMALLLLQEW